MVALVLMVFMVYSNEDKEMKEQSKKPKINIIIYSLIALGFLALTFLVDWMFIIGAVIIIYLNQKELMKRNK